MPTKIGGGGKPQEYDPSNGRYGRGAGSFVTNLNGFSTFEHIMQPKTSAKVERRRKTLDIRAARSADPLLLSVYNLIQRIFPNSVMKVNEHFALPNGDYGEVDIETKRYVIEIKGGKGKHFVRQFHKEVAYARMHNKSFIAFAPNMSYAVKREAIRQGFVIVSSEQELVEMLSKKMKGIHKS